MQSWNGLHELSTVIFWITFLKPLWIKVSNWAVDGSLKNVFLKIFGNLKRDWQVILDPFVPQNNFHKKRMALKTKIKLDFLRIFNDPLSKYKFTFRHIKMS